MICHHLSLESSSSIRWLLLDNYYYTAAALLRNPMLMAIAGNPIAAAMINGSPSSPTDTP
jgi:hypothetical protein